MSKLKEKKTISTPGNDELKYITNLVFKLVA